MNFHSTICRISAILLRAILKEDDIMMFSRRDLSKLIVPLIIESLLGVTIGMLDSMMVSNAGEAAVSGVSLVDTINLLLVYLFSAIAAGGSIIISQFLGKRDFDNAKAACKQLVWTVFTVAFMIMTISLVFRKQLLSLIFGSIEPDVMKNALVYFLFTSLGYPFLALYNGGAAIFRAMGNSKISMIASLIMNLINLIGNWILIFIFHMGAAGAAIATTLSRIVGASIMMVLLHNKHNVVYIEKIFRFKPNWTLIKAICGVGIPNGLENSMFQFGKVITQSLISTFGTMQIAANAVANTVTPLQYLPGSSIGLAMVTVVGHCIGAGEKEQAKKYARNLVLLSYASIITVSTVIVILLPQIVGLYNLSKASSDLARQLILIHTFNVCTIWPMAFTMPNAFRAASDVRYTMILSIISMWVFRVGLSYLLGGYMGYGVVGVWIAMGGDWLFRAVTFGARYIRGTWLTKYKPVVAESN